MDDLLKGSGNEFTWHKSHSLESKRRRAARQQERHERNMKWNRDRKKRPLREKLEFPVESSGQDYTSNASDSSEGFYELWQSTGKRQKTNDSQTSNGQTRDNTEEKKSYVGTIHVFIYSKRNVRTIHVLGYQDYEEMCVARDREDSIFEILEEDIYYEETITRVRNAMLQHYPEMKAPEDRVREVNVNGRIGWKYDYQRLAEEIASIVKPLLD